MVGYHAYEQSSGCRRKDLEHRTVLLRQFDIMIDWVGLELLWMDG